MSNLVVNGRFLHQQLAGVQRYGRELLHGFDRAGYEYTVAEPEAAFATGKLRQHLWEQVVLPNRISNDSVLWSPTNSGPVFADNHVITLHDIGIFPHPEWFSRAYALWKRTLIPRVVRHARKVLTVSEFSKQVICTYLDVDPGNVYVVYNGVDRDRFRPSGSDAIQEVLDKYSITQPYLLALGSMDPRKNFPRLINAWNRCAEQKAATGYQLVIAGGSNANFKRFNLQASPGSVKFLGYVDDNELAPLYSGAEGFLFPSLFEGFGLPVIEAMACGTPVVTSGTTALKEVVNNSAITIDPEDVGSIKDGIIQLIESPGLRNDLIERGFRRAEMFDWNDAAAKIYRYLMS